MEQQLDIEEHLRTMSRRDHPQTSKDAAASVKVGPLQARVLSAFEDAGPRAYRR
jgi:hypothetical protein